MDWAGAQRFNKHESQISTKKRVWKLINFTGSAKKQNTTRKNRQANKSGMLPKSKQHK